MSNNDYTIFLEGLILYIGGLSSVDDARLEWPSVLDLSGRRSESLTLGRKYDSDVTLEAYFIAEIWTPFTLFIYEHFVSHIFDINTCFFLLQLSVLPTKLSHKKWIQEPRRKRKLKHK